MMFEFSGGRVELFFKDCVQIELKGVATLNSLLERGLQIVQSRDGLLLA